MSYDVVRPWQNVATLLRAAQTIEMFLKAFRNILCPLHTICIRHKCCARGKTSQHLGSTITSSMLPPQCFLFCRGLRNAEALYCSVSSTPRWPRYHHVVRRHVTRIFLRMFRHKKYVMMLLTLRCYFNPFTPKSDQLQVSPAASAEA